MAQNILGIETSCDETAAAVVQDGHRVLSNVVHSQVELHKRWHGVVPEVASRSHTERILPIVTQALTDADITPSQLDAIAVTHRPGMVGCLLVGMAAAKALAWRFDKPLVGVDHVQAHVHTGLLAEPDMPLPALCLVASGGHTALYRLEEPGSSVRLGTTRDDAAGEALDKGAALLGLPVHADREEAHDYFLAGSPNYRRLVGAHGLAQNLRSWREAGAGMALRYLFAFSPKIAADSKSWTLRSLTSPMSLFAMQCCRKSMDLK